MTHRLKVVSHPRDPNPYQNSLHESLEQQGISVSYLPERTGSHTANILLLPLELAVARLRGVRVLHLHWVYRFAIPPVADRPWVRRLMRTWFRLWLATARLLGMSIVWTAHNALPHGQVFDDDVAARVSLLRSARAVIAHSDAAVVQLRDRGWPLPATVEVIPHGPLDSLRTVAGTRTQRRTDRRAYWGLGDERRIVGMVGAISPYKGVPELLDAWRAVASTAEFANTALVLAGECQDPALDEDLRRAAAADPRIVLHLAHLSETEFVSSLEALDVMVLPFRRITTSGSALAALGAGVPLLLDRDAGLTELPAAAVHRYTELADGLRWAATASDDDLAHMTAAASGWSAGWSWDDVAARTAAVYRTVGEAADHRGARLAARRFLDHGVRRGS